MKVVHVVNSMDPATGGPPSMVARLAAAQASAGHSVAIICRESLDVDVRSHSAFTGIPGIDRVAWLFCPAGGVTEKYLAFKAGHALRTLLKSGDFLHLHGVWCAIVSTAARIANEYGLRYAVTLHGSLNPASIAQKSWKKALAMRLGRRKLLEHAAFIHALNDDETIGLRRHRIETPVAVIPNGVFSEEIADLPPPTQFHALHPQLLNRPYILFLGRLHWHKGLDHLADAFAVFAQHNISVDLVVAGPDCGIRTEFERRISRLGLSKRVHMMGPIYDQEKLAALTGATCFCLPSRNEGFSMAITEALGCGVPVVISRECHFPEVQAAGAGEVVTLNPAGIADALLRLTGDEVRRQQASHAARRLVLENYTWPRIAERMIEAYTQNGTQTRHPSINQSATLESAP